MSDHATLDAEWHQAFDALRAAGLESDANDPIAARYRAASDAVNHSNRRREAAMFQAAADAASVEHPRKVTVFRLCPRHQGWDSEGRYRLAAVFGEGGPGSGGPCTPGDTCKIRPGTDLMVADLCVQRDWYDTAAGDHPFRWAVNA